MTVWELFEKTETILKGGDCENASFDATCILEDIGRIGRGNLRVRRDELVSQTLENAILNAAKRRAEGYPLQYLLGTWDFLGLTLEIGEGVLIPRPETELLCEEVAHRIKERVYSDRISLVDLCAGSGCVGLGIASLLPNVPLSILQLELSEQAFLYLQKNIKRYDPHRVRPILADILKDSDQFDGPIDVLVSNPPYIPTKELTTLQREVQFEPSMALDGAEDGLLFYRAIAERWFPKLAKSGIVAVEIGIGQSSAVAELFSSNGLSRVEVIKDFSAIDRVVIGVKE